MVELVLAGVGDGAEFGVDDRLEVAALGVGGLAVLRCHHDRATRPPQDVHRPEFLDRQFVEPECALALAPEARVKGDRVMADAVEDDLGAGPVLGRLHAPLEEGEGPALVPRTRAEGQEPEGVGVREARRLDPGRDSVAGVRPDVDLLDQSAVRLGAVGLVPAGGPAVVRHLVVGDGVGPGPVLKSKAAELVPVRVFEITVGHDGFGRRVERRLAAVDDERRPLDADPFGQVRVVGEQPVAVPDREHGRDDLHAGRRRGLLHAGRS